MYLVTVLCENHNCTSVSSRAEHDGMKGHASRTMYIVEGSKTVMFLQPRYLNRFVLNVTIIGFYFISTFKSIQIAIAEINAKAFDQTQLVNSCLLKYT